MGRDRNASLAVSLYEELCEAHSWGSQDAWKGIAVLLLTCQVWRYRWEDFREIVVYRESNDFKLTQSGKPNSYLRRAEALSRFLSDELGVARAELCKTIGQFWREPTIAGLQPHNLVGHAFRSLVAHCLAKFGNPAIAYEEEMDPRREFPGFAFSTRSKNPRIDILARKRNQIVAIISTRWRFRHDRVDVPDEAMQYVPAARHVYPLCRFYAVLGEFAPARLKKILNHTSAFHPNPIIESAVHFQPKLITEALGENSTMHHLRSIAWLIDETNKW